jgi:hypothetical protein
MITHEGWRLQTNRAVTESGTLGTSSDDTNVLGHNLSASATPNFQHLPPVQKNPTALCREMHDDD